MVECNMECNGPQLISAAADVAAFIVLVFAAIFGGKQIKIIEEQNRLSRIVAWKSSIQEVNDLILKYPDVFHPVLFPPLESEKEVKKTTAAYASLHALETIYHMRMSEAQNKKKEKGEDQKEEIEEINGFLQSYISGSNPIKDLWKENKTSHSAFTKEFQDVITKIVRSS